MIDFCFVIEFVDDGLQIVVQIGDFVVVIDEVQGEFEVVGYFVDRQGDFCDECILCVVEIVLVCIVWEFVMNIFKYVGFGEVQIYFDVDDEIVFFIFCSFLFIMLCCEFLFSCIGFGWMVEWVMGVSGEFSVGEVEGFWVVLVCFFVV